MQPRYDLRKRLRERWALNVECLTKSLIRCSLQMVTAHYLLFQIDKNVERSEPVVFLGVYSRWVRKAPKKSYFFYKQSRRWGSRTLVYLGLIEIWKKLGNLEKEVLAVRKGLKAISFTIPTFTGGHDELWVKIWQEKPILLSLAYFPSNSPFQEYEYYCDLMEDLISH